MDAAPLEGIRVLDLTQAIAGPYLGRMLADLGADVVKVEWPNGDVTNRFGRRTAGQTGLFTHMNAGKRGIGLDLKDPAAVAIIRRLAATADVVLENFRPRVLERAGLGWEVLSADNPRLVMASISGFGSDGPESGRASFAPVIHAESGLIARQALVDGHPMVVDYVNSFADELTALHTAVGVLAGLEQRTRTGRGTHLEVSMLEAILATDDQVSGTLDGTPPLDGRGYAWNVTGGPLMVCADHRTLWRRLSETFGLSDGLGADATVDQKASARLAAMQAFFSGFDDREDVKRSLERVGLAWAEIRDASTVPTSPTVQHRKPFAAVDDHAGGTRGVVRMPYRYDGAPVAVRGPAPLRGAHNRAVLREWLGCSDDELAALEAAGTLQTGRGGPA